MWNLLAAQTAGAGIHAKKTKSHPQTPNALDRKKSQKKALNIALF